MAISALHSSHVVVLKTTVIGAVTSIAGVLNPSISGAASAGEIYNRFLALAGQDPAFGFASYDLPTCLGACGLSGQAIATDNTFTMYAASLSATGARAATGRSFLINKGVLFPDSIGIDHRGDAAIAYKGIALYDGTNYPIVPADGVTLPTTQTDANRHTLGPVTVGGVEFDQLLSLAISFGVEIAPDSADSDMWPTACVISQASPVISFVASKLGHFNASGSNVEMLGLANTHADTSIYLRKRSQAAPLAFEADETAEHIKITTEGMIHATDVIEASTQGRAVVKFMINTKYDGSNAPIIFNTASAIT